MNENKLTAHQLWCSIIQEKIQSIILPKRILNGKNVFMTSRDEMRRLFQECRSQVNHFENTRLRVHVDKIIDELKQIDSGISQRQQQLELSHLWLFKKRRLLRSSIKSLQEQRTAYANAVCILNNTRPPDEHSPVAEGSPNTKPQMHVN
jgi:hypothetical protein